MMTLTETAAEAVRGIVANSQALSEETAGLRLFTETSPAGEPQMKVAAAKLPTEGDQVIEDGGARIFLEAELAAQLADKALDAQMTTEGAEFRIVAQP